MPCSSGRYKFCILKSINVSSLPDHVSNQDMLLHILWPGATELLSFTPIWLSCDLFPVISTAYFYLCSCTIIAHMSPKKVATRINFGLVSLCYVLFQPDLKQPVNILCTLEIKVVILHPTT